MVSEDRQRVIETNRSLRLIKNELESLLEKGVITDDAFDTITTLLPAESSLSANPAARTVAQQQQLPPTPARSTPPTPQPAAPAPTAAAAAAVPPPSYAQSTAAPPPLPIRNQPPTPAAPEKPVLAHARALYRYAAGDARDCSLERDDRVAVYEYMNADWWMGRNLRTGQEGIFPRSYVVTVDPAADEEKKQQPMVPVVPVVQQQQQYPPAPPPGQPVVPYNHHQQDDGGSGSKVGEHGKKFGKKLGNAAIFGAGATLGSKVVNSIF